MDWKWHITTWVYIAVLLLLTNLVASCSLVPLYDLKKRELCVRRDWDTYCPGYYEDDEPLYDGRSVYDR